MLLTNYKMKICKPVKTPMTLEFNNDNAQSKLFDKSIYQSLIGSLSYISNWSRPNIAHNMNQLARYNAEPAERHWQAAKRVLRYLKHTIHYSLYLEPKGELTLTTYADASFATDLQTQKSTSGTVVLLGNALVGCHSIRQKHISLSTMESEFSSLSLLCIDLICFKDLMLDLGIEVTDSIIVYEDNQAAIQMATNIAIKTRSKHTDLRYLNVRQCVQNKTIELQYCMSEENIADHFTKAQGAIKHKECCEKYGLKM